jgi:hypothetical protein
MKQPHPEGQVAIDYLDPDVPEGLETVEIPLVQASEQTLEGYGTLVDDPRSFEVEIVTWPQPGWRAVDAGTGREGGTTEGVFKFWWDGPTYRGRNEAVDGDYVLGWLHPPGEEPPRADPPRRAVHMWHANYHPDGGQLFYPLDRQPFVAPLARPGDDVMPKSFKAFYFDGTRGLYIHPGVWHEALYLLTGEGRFFDKQGKVHARVSVDFPKEFGCLVKVPLPGP